MDAVKFIPERYRMCSSFSSDCAGCEIANRMDGDETCNDFIRKHPAEAVAIVEQWAKEHPLKTRQSELLKLFPRAKKSLDGALKFCPQEVDSSFMCPLILRNGTSCEHCREEYWLEEVKK